VAKPVAVVAVVVALAVAVASGGVLPALPVGPAPAAAQVATLSVQRGTPVAAAQPATLVADADVPAPGDCRVEPLRLPLALPGPAPGATPVALLPDPAALPAGEPADDATAAAIGATAREAVACRNAGDLRRAYALMTPTMLAGLLGTAETAPPEIVVRLLEGGERPARAERIRVVVIDAVALLPDGRARARVETEAAGFRFVDLLLFVFEDARGRWLIDDALPLGREPLPGADRR
jgi:hypothetical protein